MIICQLCSSEFEYLRLDIFNIFSVSMFYYKYVQIILIIVCFQFKKYVKVYLLSAFL